MAVGRHERELLPHTAAEEEALCTADNRGDRAVGVVGAILALFESHLSKENDLLIPTLFADPHVSLSELLGGMHEPVG